MSHSSAAEWQTIIFGLTGSPSFLKASIMPICVFAGKSLTSPQARRKNAGAVKAVIEGSSWRSEPAAELRGLAKRGRLFASFWRAFSAAKSYGSYRLRRLLRGFSAARL